MCEEPSIHDRTTLCDEFRKPQLLKGTPEGTIGHGVRFGEAKRFTTSNQCLEGTDNLALELLSEEATVVPIGLTIVVYIQLPPLGT
jgi:hypothetical protein